MSGDNVIHLFPRLLSKPLRVRVHRPPPAAVAGLEVHQFTRAVIRDDVPITTLAEALASHGLTFSTDRDLGVVIHPMPPEAS